MILHTFGLVWKLKLLPESITQNSTRAGVLSQVLGRSVHTVCDKLTSMLELNESLQGGESW